MGIGNGGGGGRGRCVLRATFSATGFFRVGVVVSSWFDIYGILATAGSSKSLQALNKFNKAKAKAQGPRPTSHEAQAQAQG
jgi:hypothetical protein